MELPIHRHVTVPGYSQLVGIISVRDRVVFLTGK
jgi:hypothetical protein